MAAYELKYTAEEIDGILESVDEKTIYGDATQSEHGLMSTTDKAKLDSLPTSQQIDTSLSGKVDKVNGKGLSTNDYDNTAKAKVDAIPADPKYTDTVYDDTALAGRVSTIEGKESGWDAKQEALVSGTNIKTVNGESLLGSGNIEIQGGGEENVIEAITMNGSSVPVTNKTAAITETDPTVPSWAKQPSKPSYNYSEIGNTPDLSGFITKSVNDLTNYYLKSETYTKDEVAALIGAIQQFHYEIYTTLPASGESNVLYLIGPTGSGSDRYEEYVYSNSAFTKIGDTSIDLSGYVTTSALNTALADYTTTTNLATLLAGKQDTISDLATIRSGAALGATAYQKPSGGIPASDLASGVIPDISGKEDTSNKVTSFQITPDDTHYPSEKLVKDSIDAVDKVFWATYGTTTASEVEAALQAGKIVIVKETGAYYFYASKDINYYYFSRISGDTLTSVRLKISDSTYSKSPNGNALQFTNRIVSTISGNETNTTKYPNTKAVYDAIHPAIATTEPSGGMLPNVLYQFGELSGNTTFTLATPTDNTIANHYYFTFDTPSTAPTITWPTGLTWFGGSALTISASKHYEISVLNGIAIAMEV